MNITFKHWKGKRVITPDGPGTVVGIGAGKCMGQDITGQLLVTIENDKYFPHWDIYYKKSEVKKPK